ncbi:MULTISPECIES: hypothetical protein [Mesorhizobium]|uniref:hypothetical protein n=1 Tax=Mesorhizobium TaxID=68287 RepID=UPI0010C083E4|nr:MULTISPECIES: hypothetical protein [Mesorhizobium]
MAIQATFGKAHDFIDADYVVVAPDTREEPASRNDPFAASSGMEMLRNRKFVEARDPNRAGPLFWAGGLALAAVAFWVSGGHALLNTTIAPTHAAIPAQLRISGWDSKINSTGTNPTLLIDGEVVNDGTASEPMPSLQIEVASPNGTSTHYKLGTGDASIDGQGTFPFSGRLHLPKDGVKTVSVSFAQ